MGDTLVYFYTPSEMAGKTIGPDRRVRVGGLVEQGSVKKEGSTVTFTITDLTATLPAIYTGVLPDLFREGQGVVAEGRVGRDGMLHASEVLAKHDEKYMPKEVADQLKKSGRWQEGPDTQK
jgi:cytochrome c-type biogenesis protein CcmE